MTDSKDPILPGTTVTDVPGRIGSFDSVIIKNIQINYQRNSTHKNERKR